MRYTDDSLYPENMNPLIISAGTVCADVAAGRRW
jgi:hypothetical protein